MLWSIDSCKNRVSDQYHLPHRGLRYRPIEVEYYLKLSADKLLVLKWSKAQVHIFTNSYVVFEICHFGPALLRFWFQTRHGRENSASYLKIQVEKTFSYSGHALATLYVQFLCSDWSKFDRWVHAENVCSILKLVYFDNWSWQSFVSTCDAFNCLFPLDVQNEVKVLSRVFCYSWLVCLLLFWFRDASLESERVLIYMSHKAFNSTAR